MELTLHYDKAREAMYLGGEYLALKALKDDKHSLSKVLKALEPFTDTNTSREAGTILEELIDVGIVTIR